MKPKKLINNNSYQIKCDECDAIIPNGAEYWLESVYEDPDAPCEFVWCLEHGKEFENGIITDEMIQELREKTNAGRIDCRKALEEANGNQMIAIKILSSRYIVR